MELSVREGADCDDCGDVGRDGRTDSTSPDSDAEETCNVKSPNSGKGDCGNGSGERVARSLPIL